MPSFEDYVTDAKTYPNETVVRMADGSEVTLGSIRAGYMKDADYRRKTTEVAQRHRDLEQREAAIEEAQQRLSALAERITQQAVQREPQVSQSEVDDEIASNPAAKKLMARIDQLQQMMQPLARSVVDMDKRLQQQTLDYMTEQHRRVVAKLKEADPDLDEKVLVDYARSNYIPRLDAAYRAMKYDDAIKAAETRGKEEGLKLGEEKAKKEMVVPSILPTRRRPAPAQDAPKTLDEAVARASQDPEVVGGLLGMR